MFSMLKNLSKAAVSVALSPVALVADLCTLPASAMDTHAGPFDRTAKLLSNAGDAVKKAVEPE